MHPSILILWATVSTAQLLVPSNPYSEALSGFGSSSLSVLAPVVAASGTVIPGSFIAVLDDAAEFHIESFDVRTLKLGKKTVVEPFGFSPELAVSPLLPSTTRFPRGFIFKNMNHVDLKKVRELKAIKYIEPDQVVHATLPRKKSENDVGRVRIPEDGHETTDGRVHIPEEGNENQGEHMTVPEDGSEVQASPPWGLARVSHELKPDFTRVNDYWYNQNDGLGVDVYVVDTGINIKHVEFQGRAVWGATIPDGDKDEDGNGHGTHVAGTISAKTFGVAKKANTVAVKVLRSNGSGSMSDVLKGIEWVARDHVQKNQGEDSIQAPAPYKRTGNKKSVANMSLGGGKSDALDRAVDGAVSVGVHFAVAAGNDNADACKYSPAASKKSITVLATTINDDRATFSNWGRCVDIGAPGFQILSTWIGSNTANNTISGTSMASPHVAGVIAAYVSRVDSGWDTLTPAQLKLKLIDVAVKNVIKGMPKGSGTKNFLVYNSAPVHEHESVFKKGDGESL